jgi:fatty-acyl-CoA synthase
MEFGQFEIWSWSREGPVFLGDWLSRRAMLTPGKIALVDVTRGGREITYRHWNRAANQSALLLRGLGVGKGDRVSILAHNCFDYLDLWFACGKLGAILQLLNWRLTPLELADLIIDATPRVLVYGPEFVDQVRLIRAWGSPELTYLALAPDCRSSPGDRSHDERESLDDTAPPPLELEWSDPWVLAYTGGTTGVSKGAILTHGNITWNAVKTVASWGLAPDDVTLLSVPMFHTGGLNVFTAPLVLIGGTSMVCRGFDAQLVFDLIRDAPVTIFFGVPTMFQALQNHARWESADFSRLKLVISGGAPCPSAVYERFWDRGIAFRSGYGLTEAGPNTFWLPDEDVRRKPGSVGFPLFHVDVKIVDGAGRECGPDEVGELLIRGPHVCAGYWKRPEETSRTLRDGWLHTGDLARRDREGYHYIVGRLKDLIISGGENIYPAEVEEVLASHPAVDEVAVIGVTDSKWGETPRALVVARSGARLDLDELLRFGSVRLARYKLPRSVVLVAELPRTAAGKIDKERLRKALGAS